MSQSSSSVRTPYGKGVLIFGDGAPGPSDPTAVRPFAEPSMGSAAKWLRDGAAVTIGAYDGVHLGHRAVIAKLTSTAQRRGLASVVVKLPDECVVELAPGADAEPVLDVPAKLSARLRFYATGQGRKTDDTDAHSITLVGVRMAGLRPVVAHEQIKILRLLVDRRRRIGEVGIPDEDAGRQLLAGDHRLLRLLRAGPGHRPARVAAAGPTPLRDQHRQPPGLPCIACTYSCHRWRPCWSVRQWPWQSLRWG